MCFDLIDSFSFFSFFFNLILMEFKLLAKGAGHFTDGSVDYGLLDTLRYDDAGLLLLSNASPTHRSPALNENRVLHDTFDDDKPDTTRIHFFFVSAVATIKIIIIIIIKGCRKNNKHRCPR